MDVPILTMLGTFGSHSDHQPTQLWRAVGYETTIILKLQYNDMHTNSRPFSTSNLWAVVDCRVLVNVDAKVSMATTKYSAMPIHKPNAQIDD